MLPLFLSKRPHAISATLHASGVRIQRPKAIILASRLETESHSPFYFLSHLWISGCRGAKLLEKLRQARPVARTRPIFER
jgi:hypothetical protein